MFSLGEETTLPKILSCKQTTAAARFIMAAPAEKGTGVCEDSSSSDDEELRRCQEAVWETRGDLRRGEDCSVMKEGTFPRRNTKYSRNIRASEVH